LLNKQTLREYQNIVKEIRQLQDERERLLGLSSTQITGMLHGTSVSNPTGRAGVKLAELSEMLTRKIDRLISLRVDIEDAIAGLDSNDKILMRLSYIDGKRWEQIAVDMNYDYRWVTRLHGRILEKIKMV